MTRILVVDDNEYNLKLLSYDLADDGYRTLTALSGEQALQVARNDKPDLILLDVLMPEMDGLEVLRRLKSGPQTREIPVIMVSAKDSDDDIVAALDAGAHDYITKPYYYPIVAARVRAAARLKKIQDTLNHLNQDINHARLLAEQSSQSKSSFLHHLSREVRGPMQSILGAAQLLEHHTQPDGQEQLTHIQQAGEQLLRFFERVLDFSRIESGDVECDNGPFNPRAAIDAAVELITPSLHQHARTLQVQVAPEVPLGCNGDSGRIEQLLLELLSNAIAHSDQGPISLDVRVQDHLNDGQWMVRFSVRDQGPGLDAEAQTALFQGFAQAHFDDGPLRVQYGLGIAICKRLVALLRGHIGVNSHPGEGSEFWFTVPLSPLLPGEQPNPHWQELQGERLWVLGASPPLRQQLEQQLRLFHCQVLFFEQGDDALRLLSRGLTDQLPTALLIDGDRLDNWPQLAEDFRALGGNQPIPLLLLHSQPPANLSDYPVHEVPLVPPLTHQQLYQGLSALKVQQPSQPLATKASLPNAEAPILVAEDNIINQQVTSKMLHHLGYEVALVNNGQEAVAALSEGRFSLVLMDCHMPVMDGFSATQVIRAQQAPAKGPWRIPIIALTARALSGDRESCLAAGMDDYLAKPVKITELREKLSVWLNARPDAAAS